MDFISPLEYAYEEGSGDFDMNVCNYPADHQELDRSVYGAPDTTGSKGSEIVRHPGFSEDLLGS